MKLEKFNYSSGKRSRWFLYGFILAVVLMVLINLFFSEAKYLKTESVKIAEGTINYKPYDFKIMAMYQENDSGEYQEIDSMPISGYVINEEKSYCTIDNVNKDNDAVLKTIDGNHTFNNLSKNHKCYVWFDKVSTIQNIIETHNLTIRSDFSTALTTDTTGTLFMAPDDYGTSYYFAGASTDNWVKFAGFYWRIIRINGDGTLRLIYSGSEESGPALIGEDTQISNNVFNSLDNNNMYVGYMYENGVVHGYNSSSTIKVILDNWYDNKLIDYFSFLDIDAGYCGDRNLYSGSGIGTNNTQYSAYDRLIYNSNPTLRCENISDLYTLSISDKGNKALSKPIGLISMDEIMLAGASRKNANTDFYLYTNKDYWTITPCNYNGGAAMFYMNESGKTHVVYNVNWEKPGTRPVINLKSDTQFSNGVGTIDNPYVVS